MAIYYLTCAISVLFASAFERISESRKKGIFRTMAIIVSSLPLFILASIRYGVGTDYFNYIKHYKLALRGVRQKEFLYYLVNRIVGKMGLEYQWVLVVCSAIFFLVVFKHIFDESPYPALSIFLIVGMTHYFAYQNIVRQMIGGAIVMYGLRYVQKKELIKFVICILLAAGFHFSCALFIILYWYDKIKLTPGIAVALSGVIFALAGVMARIIMMIIMHTKLAWYIGSEYDSSVVGYVYLLVQFAVLMLASLSFNSSHENSHLKINVSKGIRKKLEKMFPFLKWQEEDDRKYKLYYTAQVINLWIALFSGRIALIDRFRYLFGFPAIILIPLAIKRIKIQPLRILVMGAVVFCFIVYSYLVTTSGNHGALPYRTIFSVN